jgi:hypothetical protein
LLCALLRLRQLLNTLLCALLRLGQLPDSLVCTLLRLGQLLLRLGQFPDVLLSTLLGLCKLLDDAPEFGEVVTRHELVVHFHVKVCDELRLVGGERRLETVSDFREADHGAASP